MRSRLPAFLQWTFMGFSILCLVAAGAIALIMLIDPQIGQNAHFSTNVAMSTHPGALVLQLNGGTQVSITELQANISGRGDDGLIRIFKQYGLPVALVYALFFAWLFDCLRRLFRNVRRGNSFTPQTIRLVRVIGFSLIGFSLVSAGVEGLLSMALIDYLRAHISAPGLTWVMQAPAHGGQVTFEPGAPVFLAGLLVLALAEVFRQGLALKNDNDLTI
jgi:hypothetical protein